MGERTVTEYETVEKQEMIPYCDECSADVESKDELWPIVGNPRLDLMNESRMESIMGLVYSEAKHRNRSYEEFRARFADQLRHLDFGVTADVEQEVCADCYETITGTEPSNVPARVPINARDAYLSTSTPSSFWRVGGETYLDGVNDTFFAVMILGTIILFVGGWYPNEMVEIAGLGMATLGLVMEFVLYAVYNHWPYDNGGAY